MSPQNSTLSHRFISALDPRRDGLYALALGVVERGSASATVSRSERLLQSAIREVFAAFEKDGQLDPPEAVEKALLAQAPALSPGARRPAPAENTVMPADVWARLVATVQVEAARSAHTRAINPDSVLLSPDPLLAPKKTAAPDDAERLDSPSSRFLLAGAVAVLVAVVLTVYLLTRPASAPRQDTATTAPGAVPLQTSTPAQR